MWWYKQVIHNCKKATLLIEKKNERRISPLEQLELGLHLIGCSVCRLYKKQSQLIDQMLGQSYKNSLEEKLTLDKDFKKRLDKIISDELKNK